MTIERQAALDALKSIVGADHALTDPALLAGALIEPRGLYHGKALALVRPGSTAEVARVLAFCNEARIGVTPQGGNTGLVGGQTPDESGDEIILSTQRLKRIREIDPHADVMICEAGVTLAEAQAAALDSRPALPAVARRGGHLHHRRQRRDQRRRRDRDRLRQRARPRHRRRGGARRRADRQRAFEAAQGQHRLRREKPVRRLGGHARRDHGGVAQALSQSAGAGDRLCRPREPGEGARPLGASRASGSARA